MWFGTGLRTIAILMIVLAANSSALAARIALCIGINDYAGQNRLNGCVNDANAWAGYFTTAKFDNVKLLLDGRATRTGIINAIEEIIGNAQSGDIVVIQYAGHGTAVPDRSGDEGMDEAIVPVDLDVIVDDDIGPLLDKANAGVAIYIIFDCCKSGTGTRVFNAPMVSPRGFGDQTRGRFMIATPGMIARAQERKLDRTGSRGVFEPNARMREVLFAACQPFENSLESNQRGVFTTAALSVLRSGFAGTNNDFINRVVAAMGQQRPQTPQLSCSVENQSGLLFGLSVGPGATPVSGPGICATPVAEETPQATISTYDELLAELRFISGKKMRTPRSLVPLQNHDEKIEFYNEWIHYLKEIAAGN